MTNGLVDEFDTGLGVTLVFVTFNTGLGVTLVTGCVTLVTGLDLKIPNILFNHAPPFLVFLNFLVFYFYS